MASSKELPKRLKYGTLLATIAGCFPLLVGTTMFIVTQISVFHPDRPWSALQLPPGPTEPAVSLDDVKAWNADFAGKFHVAQHIQYVNVMNAGLAVIFLSWFGVRARLKWAWVGALVIGSWIGLNDAITTLLSGQLPIPLIPTALVLIGLFVARPEVFEKES